MKMKDVEVGARYVAKVSNKLTVVKVLRIDEVQTLTCVRKRIVVLNQATNRTLIFRSAQRLRRKYGQPD